MSEVGDSGMGLLYRFAAKRLLPASWFRRIDPARIRKAERRGRLRDEPAWDRLYASFTGIRFGTPT